MLTQQSAVVTPPIVLLVPVKRLCYTPKAPGTLLIPTSSVLLKTAPLTRLPRSFRCWASWSCGCWTWRQPSRNWRLLHRRRELLDVYWACFRREEEQGHWCSLVWRWKQVHIYNSNHSLLYKLMSARSIFFWFHCTSEGPKYLRMKFQENSI